MPPGTTGNNRDDRENISAIDIPKMVTARQREPGAVSSASQTISGGSPKNLLDAFDSVLSLADLKEYSELKAHSKTSEVLYESDLIDELEIYDESELCEPPQTITAQQAPVAEPQAKKSLSIQLPAFKFPFAKKTKRKRKRRFRPTPPGQKLLKGILVACILLLGQALFRYPGIPLDLTEGQSRQVTIEPPFQLTTPLTQLQTDLSALNKVKSIQAGVFAINLENGQYVDSDGQQAFSAASMIKLPILVSFLMAVERGECSMDDELEIRPDLITNGSGFLQWKPPGTKISAKKAAQLMIMVSDNTATNLLIDLLGGFDHVNKDFHRWGLKQTKVNHLLADLEGTNTTCPYDLVYLLGRVDHGELVTPEHRAFMYEIMAKCKNRSLLPPGLGSGATIIHKTGTIGAMVGDAGIVTTSGGTRYAVAIQCSRKRNDSHANNLIREMSRHIYATYVLQLPRVKSKPAPKPGSKAGDKFAGETPARIRGTKSGK